MNGMIQVCSNFHLARVFIMGAFRPREVRCVWVDGLNVEQVIVGVLLGSVFRIRVSGIAPQDHG